MKIENNNLENEITSIELLDTCVKFFFKNRTMDIICHYSDFKSILLTINHSAFLIDQPMSDKAVFHLIIEFTLPDDRYIKITHDIIYNDDGYNIAEALAFRKIYKIIDYVLKCPNFAHTIDIKQEEPVDFEELIEKDRKFIEESSEFSTLPQDTQEWIIERYQLEKEAAKLQQSMSFLFSTHVEENSRKNYTKNINRYIAQKRYFPEFKRFCPQERHGAAIYLDILITVSCAFLFCGGLSEAQMTTFGEVMLYLGGIGLLITLYMDFALLKDEIFDFKNPLDNSSQLVLVWILPVLKFIILTPIFYQVLKAYSYIH
ncbi:MAG: hypothetical protein NC390_04320 [Fusobacterium sp.]|nr:hypothetical protein [Fusobacterium sp.]